MNTKKMLLVAFATVACASAGVNLYVSHFTKNAQAALADLEALAAGEGSGVDIIGYTTSQEMYCQIVFFHGKGDEYGQAPNFDGVPQGAQVVATCDGHEYYCIPQEGSVCSPESCECN